MLPHRERRAPLSPLGATTNRFRAVTPTGTDRAPSGRIPLVHPPRRNPIAPSSPAESGQPQGAKPPGAVRIPRPATPRVTVCPLRLRLTARLPLAAPVVKAGCISQPPKDFGSSTGRSNSSWVGNLSVARSKLDCPTRPLAVDCVGAATPGVVGEEPRGDCRHSGAT